MNQQKYYNLNFDFGLISQLSGELNLHEKIVEVLFSRGYTSKEKILKFLSPSERDFHDPFLLSGMQEAVDKIRDAVSNKKRILVFGDYDVDGMSATAVLYNVFKKLGTSIDFFLPNRFVDGYGLTNDVIDKIKAKYNPELIITVDCGISCKEEVDYANSLGIDMIVTDHHEPPELIPSCVVVNPKLANQKYSFKELCGTGVAFKLGQALLGMEEVMNLLPIVAVATIADIVSLTDENRALVTLGLKNFERDMPLGYKYLFAENKLKTSDIASVDVAFKIAPKLNSSGRMGDATDSLKLMISENVSEIKELIKKINTYNTKRQKVCNDCYEDCIKMLEDVDLSKERAIILENKKWDHGILGIVAARLVEKFNRPAFLFSEDEGMLKGSARSINDINVHEILSGLGDILETFGGHKMAAGLTLKKDKFEEFSKRVNAFIFSHVSPDVFKPITYYDVEINISDIDEKFIQDLRKLEPFGIGNSNLLLKISSENANVSPLKMNSNHFTINIDKKLELIYFNCSENYYNLKYSKEKNFIFELQFEKPRGLYKGIVKNFEGSFTLDSSFKESLNAIMLNELCFKDKNDNLKIENYKEEDIVSFIAELNQNPFGTIFVANSLKSYNEFISKYELLGIYKTFIFDKFTSGGFNAISLLPTNLDVFKNYFKIIFLDEVLDKSFLAEISKISSAKFYIPADKQIDSSIFQNINPDRKFIGNFYKTLQQFNCKMLLNEFDLYNKISRNFKISFKNFFVYLKIFEELGFIKITREENFSISIEKTSKKDLSESVLYNRLRFNEQIFRKVTKWT